MAKLWSDLQDYYLNDVPGCSQFTAANALRMAAQEFCARTKAWRVTFSAVNTVSGTSVYSFPITSEQEVAKVISAKLAGQDVFPLLHDQAGGRDFGIITLNELEFMLQPTPAAVQALVIKAVLKPSNASTGIEDHLYAAYARAIARGAKAELFGMVNQPFSNPVGAIANKSAFEDDIGRAKIQVAKAYSSAPLRTTASFM